MKFNKMNCILCKDLPKDKSSTNNDCVLLALEKIKVHYLSLKDVASVRGKELQKLRQRNEKLVKAVELLQREQLRSTLSCISQESPQRRREISTRKSLGEKESQYEIDACVAPTNADTTADDLNMALNSEQIFSCSSADTSTQLSPNRNESISETEKVNSPRLLRTSFEMRRETLKKQKPSPLKSNENIAPAATGVAGGVRKTNSGWMGKEKQVSNNSLCVTEVKKVGSFAKPLAVNLPKVERKPSLSLKKPPKLKQTRLQLDVSREKSFTGSDSTFCEEVIGASPNPSAMKKQEKPGRSWLLRVSSSVKNADNKADRSNFPEGRSSNLDADDDDFGDVFDFSFKPNSPEQKKSQTKTLPDFNPFKLNDSPEKAVESMQNKESVSNSSSVMILTPATQDIIFIDDSYNDNTHIGSMDLLQDLLKCDDSSLENLKRIEGEKIKKLQRTASTVPKLETNVLTKQQFRSGAELSKINSLPTNAATGKQPELKVKQEKVTQEPTQTTSKMHGVKRKSKDISSEEEEEEEDLMPQPFIVKQEKLDDGITKKVPELKNKQFNIKERFKIDCRDCQQYIDFLGERMTDKEIMEHLQRCTRHQRKDDINSTPDGFWDPFIATLDANDPRNETLIDTRFCNKNK